MLAIRGGMTVKKAMRVAATVGLLALALGPAAEAKVVVNFRCGLGDIYGTGVRKVAEAFNKGRNDIEVKVS